MKPLVIALAVVAAIAALFFRPPNPLAGGTPVTAAAPAPLPSGTLDAVARAEPTAVAAIVVYVAGDVVRPGVYAIPPGRERKSPLREPVAPNPDADLVAVNLAERLDDGAEVAVPKIGDDPAASARPAQGKHHRRKRGKHHRRRKPDASDVASTTADTGKADTPDAGRAAVAVEPVDLNTADVERLQSLPGIGLILAQRIVAYREQNGPFRSIDELVDVAGVTPAMAARAENLIIVR